MKKIILLVVVLSTFFTANATHMMGGEITWKCIKDPLDPDVGKYIFTMKLYRDCAGVIFPASTQTINVSNHPTVTQLPVNFITSTDISPIGNSINSGNLCLDCNSNPIGAVEEYIYISQPVDLPGLPPPSGWHFTWDSCCRNGATSNLVLSSTTSPSEGFTLRASMFPYFDPSTGLQVPASPCFDSSPIFNESPKTIICTGYPFSYSHNASDEELDAVSYSWDEPLDDFFGAFNPAGGNPPPVAWLAPYTVNSPLPGGVSLDPVTGEISYNSNISGNFATVVRVDAYKCNQLVASIYREIQAVLIACPTMPNGTANNPPIITAPVGTQTWTTTFNPSGLPSYSTTVNAGTFITFDIVGNDLDQYAAGVMQDLTMEISGGQMAVDYITTTACDNPPCATFTDLGGNPPPITAPSLVSGVFEWQTDCNQILSDAGCGATTNIFTFLVKVYDDFCPANAITIATMKITILPSTTQSAPIALSQTVGVGLSVPDLTATGTNITWYDDAGLTNVVGTGSPFATGQTSLGIYTYYVTETDINGCESEATTVTLEIFSCQVSVNSIVDVDCHGENTGSVIAEGAGIVGSYHYVLQYINSSGLWQQIAQSPAAGTYTPTSVQFTQLWAGSYRVLMTDSLGCSDTVNFSLTEPPIIVSNGIVIDESTPFSNNGSITLNVSGGIPGYSYSWVGPNGFADTNQNINNLSAGVYELTITDSLDCLHDTTLVVGLVQSCGITSSNFANVLCYGDSSGSINVDGVFGISPFSYSIEFLNGSGVFVYSSSDTSFIFNSIPAGSYRVLMTDSLGCSDTVPIINISQPNPIAITTVMTLASIFTACDGSIQSVVTGGVPPYYYSWSDSLSQTGDSAIGLCVGQYCVEVTDENGCIAVECDSVESVFPCTDSIQLTLTINDETCRGGDGSLELLAGNGHAPYYYSINGGLFDTISGSSVLIDSLMSGNYV